MEVVWLCLCLVCFPKLRFVHLFVLALAEIPWLSLPFISLWPLCSKNNVFIARTGERSLKAGCEGPELCTGIPVGE